MSFDHMPFFFILVCHGHVELVVSHVPFVLKSLGGRNKIEHTKNALVSATPCPCLPGLETIPAIHTKRRHTHNRRQLDRLEILVRVPLKLTIFYPVN